MSLAIARTLIRGLAASGLRHVVICPGSRSAPLAVAAARENGLEIHSVIDERSAGFFALGLARATGRPAAVVCTSGTAGAHLYPAVIEAATAAVPLIAITADRPTELQQAMAPQTIDQRDLFGRFVRASLAVDAASSAAALRGAARIAAQAMAAARGPIPGPVHINAPARKPLLAAGGVELRDDLAAAPVVYPPRLRCAPDALADIAARVERARRPLLCAGALPLSARRWRGAAHAAAVAQSMPLLAEATSQLRLCPTAAEVPALSWFADALLEPPPEALRPDLVIALGVPSGAGLLRLMADPDVELVTLAPHQVADPANRASAIAVGDVGEMLEAIAAAPVSDPANRRQWVEAWRAADRNPATFEASPTSGQAAVAAALEALPSGSAVVAGNSLVVRWLDQSVGAGALDLDVVSQRGASGIDGMIAGAAGVAAAGDRPVCLLVGDVSFAHDIGSLSLAAARRSPLILVVLDNGGGKIFDELAYAGELGAAERRLFVTPPKVSFSAAAAAFAVAASETSDAAALAAAVAEASGRAGPTLICARIDPASRRAI